MKMKLYEALNLRKSLQGDLAQLINLRTSTFVHAHDEKPEFEYSDLTERIKYAVNRITKIKLAIQRANLDTVLPNGLSLAESIIEIANVREAISQLTQLMQTGASYRDLMGRRTNVNEIVMVKQEQPSELLRQVQEYELRRRSLDSLIQEANHTGEVSWEEEGES